MKKNIVGLILALFAAFLGGSCENGSLKVTTFNIRLADMTESSPEREWDQRREGVYNVVNPDSVVEKFGADTLRLYEMFLGPLEASKPWDTNGIDGVHRFLKRLWNLVAAGDGFAFSDEKATAAELKSLHKLIKKLTWDIEHFSFNTAVSAFMICLNELGKCNKREIIQPLIVLLTPFAPHICEELWQASGGEGSVCDAQWPACNEAYLVENTAVYSISFNGKTRFTMEFPMDATAQEIEAQVLANEQAQKYIEGRTPRKVIVVPKKIVNIVL